MLSLSIAVNISRPHSSGACGIFWEVLQVWELWGDEPPPTLNYFEGGDFISEGFRSPFDNMFDPF